MRCENCSNHQMRRTQSEPPSLYKVPTYSTRAGAAPCAPGGACHGGGNRAVTSQPRTGQSTSYIQWEEQQTHRTREPHQEGQGQAQQTRRRGTARQKGQPEQREQGTKMEGMGERAHGRQRQ